MNLMYNINDTYGSDKEVDGRESPPKRDFYYKEAFRINTNSLNNLMVSNGKSFHTVGNEFNHIPNAVAMDSNGVTDWERFLSYRFEWVARNFPNGFVSRTRSTMGSRVEADVMESKIIQRAAPK